MHNPIYIDGIRFYLYTSESRIQDNVWLGSYSASFCLLAKAGGKGSARAASVIVLVYPTRRENKTLGHGEREKHKSTLCNDTTKSE